MDDIAKDSSIDLNSSLTRRSFVATAAAGAGALAAAGLSCGRSWAEAVESADEVQWDEERSIVIAGSGMSLFAALYAFKNGEDVLVLEKGSFLGGTSSLSGVGLFMPMNPFMPEPDDRDAAIACIKEMSEGYTTDELAEAYVDGCEKYFGWVVDNLDIQWWSVLDSACGNPDAAYLDYYCDYQNYRPGRGLLPSRDWAKTVLPEGSKLYAISGGAGVFAYLRNQMDELGIPYRLETPVTKLVTDASGAVVGVEATQADGAVLKIRARKGVLLSTGGIDHNAEMRKAFLRTPIYNTCAVTTNTGDGILMGLSVGASLSQMQQVWGLACYAPAGVEMEEDSFFNDWNICDGQTTKGFPGSIIVNKFGRRFVDETASYNCFNRAFDSYEAAGTRFSKNIPGFLICDAEFVEKYPLIDAVYCSHYWYEGYEPKVGWDNLPENAVVADTLEELAEKCGIDYAGLSWQVEQWNKFCEDGVDLQYARGEARYAQWMIENRGIDTDKYPNPSMGPIQTPPFVCLKLYPGVLSCKGGLRTDGNAQVLRQDGTPIPGLYASGGGANSPLGEGYPTTGAPIATGMIMSMIAVGAAMER